MPNKSTESKRQVYLASRLEKVLAVRRVMNGESKVHVRKTSGIPEATLRGWCKRPEIIEAAKRVEKNATPVAALARALSPLVPCWDPRSFVADSYNKTDTNNENGANLGTTESFSGSSSGYESANRCYKTQAGSESENDSGVADLSDASNDSVINKTKRATKRKRVQSESTDDDVPAKYRAVDAGEKITSSSENQQVNDLDSRNGKDLVYELFSRDIVTRDVFIYFWETLKSLEF